VQGWYGHDGISLIAERHGVPDAGPERSKAVRDPGTGVGPVVPHGIDSEEVG